MCLCKRAPGFVAARGRRCADLAWAPGHSLPAQAGTHLLTSPGVRPAAGDRSRLIPHPAAVREAEEPYRLACLSPAGQGGPGSSGFRRGASAGGTGEKLNSSSGLSPALLNERWSSGAAERSPPPPRGELAPKHGAGLLTPVLPVCRNVGCARVSGCMGKRGGFLVPSHLSAASRGWAFVHSPIQARRRLRMSDHCSCWRNTLRVALEAPAPCRSRPCPAVHQGTSRASQASLPEPVFNGCGRVPGFRGLSQRHGRARALGEEERGAGGGKGERRRSWELLTDLLFMECGSSLVDTVQMAAISW